MVSKAPRKSSGHAMNEVIEFRSPGFLCGTPELHGSMCGMQDDVRSVMSQCFPPLDRKKFAGNRQGNDSPTGKISNPATRIGISRCTRSLHRPHLCGPRSAELVPIGVALFNHITIKWVAAIGIRATLCLLRLSHGPCLVDTKSNQKL